MALRPRRRAGRGGRQETTAARGLRPRAGGRGGWRREGGRAREGRDSRRSAPAARLPVRARAAAARWRPRRRTRRRQAWRAARVSSAGGARRGAGERAAHERCCERPARHRLLAAPLPSSLPGATKLCGAEARLSLHAARRASGRAREERAWRRASGGQRAAEQGPPAGEHAEQGRTAARP